MSTIVLVTGGSRSGKSSYALEKAGEYTHRGFIATAEAVDDEMKQRIEAHRKERRNSFVTIEEPLNIADAVVSLGDDVEVIVVDCLTVWLGNVLHKNAENPSKPVEIDSFLEILGNPPCDMFIVTNEVGMGIVPHNELARKFRDIAGFVNQQVARIADSVVFMVSGIPVIIKGK